MMNFLAVLFLTLHSNVLAFNYPNFVNEYSNDERVEVYGVIDWDKCPKVVQPLCGTNGKEFVYFENKCYFEAKNYERLTQGLIEYYKCPLKYCESDCPKCTSVYKPVCAVQVRTGEKKTFSNPCEAKRTSCINKKQWRIISPFECDTHYNSRVLKPPKAFSYNTDCPEFCPLEYQPICARFMTLEKEFSNSCELRVTICQTKQKWDIINRGPCQSSDYNMVTEFYAIDDVCPRPCPLEYKPVCAKLHNELKVFNNKCELQNAVCKGHDWQVIQEGSCWQGQDSLQHKECPEYCTNQYRPVCAEYKGQQREFGNSCKLLKAICDTNIKWKVVKYDSCSLNAITDSCPKYCPREYKPVCATYKNEIREFTNKCLLENWNCKSDKTWEILQMGPCASHSENTMGEHPSCTQFCSREYEPVCAEFNNKLKEFKNICEMQKHNCETNKNWQLLKKGHCPSASKPPCPTSCTKEYNPVCVKVNGKLKEFPNKCVLEKSSCEIHTEWDLVTTGPCPANQMEKRKESPCVNEALEPICATDEFETKTFNNICQLGEEIKRTKNNWLILHKGICSSTAPTKTTAAATSSHPTTALQETSTQATTTTERQNTTAATTSTTLKATQYQPTETATAPYKTTTSFATTNKPKTNHPAIERTTTSERTEGVTEATCSGSKEHSGEDVVHSGSSISTVVYDLISSFSYAENSDDTNYPSSFGHYVQSSHSNETNGEVKGNNCTHSKEKDANYSPLSKENSTKTTERNSKHNAPTEEISKEERKYSDDKSKEKCKDSKNSNPIQETNKIENEKDISALNFLEGKSLTKWIEDHVLNLLKRLQNSQDIKQMQSEERQYNSQSEKSDSEESQKGNENYDEYPGTETKSQEKAAGLKPTRLNEVKTEYKVDGNEAYDSQGHRNETQYNNNNMDNKCSDTHETSTQTEKAPESYKENGINLTDNTDIFATTENATCGKLTSLEDETTLKYSDNEKSDSHPDPSPAKYNSSQSKKGEIYNGVVYKAPIYDAPTYNFIYTAPFNFHGLGPHHNNSSVVNHTHSGAAAKSSFDVYHFLSSLSATSGSFAKSNLLDHNHSQLPPQPFKSVNDKILAPTHLTLPTALSPPNGHYLTSLAALNRNFASKIPNFLSVKQYGDKKTSEPKQDHNNHPALEAYKSAMVTSPKGRKILSNSASSTSPNPPAPSYHSAVPKQLPTSSPSYSLNHSNSPQISLNSTLLKQIVETLKIISNRYNSYQK